VPQPPTWINLGNMGTPARSLEFSPIMKSGWDPGWHAYDIYTFRPDETKFFHTTKPYTELAYMLGSKAEQFIDVVHTQNIRPNWNFAIEYRLINAPGSFQNQNSNHNNYRLSSWYQSKNKRYQNFFVLVASKLAASENGGIQNYLQLDSVAYSNQHTVFTNLGNNLTPANANPFNSILYTASRYSNLTVMMRQQYDLGQKDSIVTDTTVIPLFYPRVRAEHTISYSTYKYSFQDEFVETGGVLPYTLDSLYYAEHYNLNYISPTDTFFRQDRWKVFSNDFSLYQFPDSHNPQQFLKLGANLDIMKGAFDTANLSLGSQVITVSQQNDYNVFAHAEYRNKSKNQKWDIEAFGKLYLAGMNSGDYNAYISLKRLISQKVGYFQAGFENVNRTPSFTFDKASRFNYDPGPGNFLKENSTHLFASLDQPRHQLLLTGSYYLMSNYTYVTDYYKEQQASSLFTLLRVGAYKQFTLYRHWKWRTNTVLQQVAGSSPVHVPLIVSFNQIGYDGSFGFRNLFLSFGTEVRIITKYKPDGYAPITGQFYSQGDTSIRQRRPDIALYLHLRVRGFTAYVRAENVNTMAFSPAGFGFYRNNFVAPSYPSPGLVIRFGFWWSFIN
jgi:hypothetical protein